MRSDSSFTRNLTWFIGSLALAFVVWVIANVQLDPVQRDIINNIPVRVEADKGMILVNRSEARTPARAQVRARESVLEIMERSDITIIADISDLPAGTHIVPLTAQTPRRAFVEPIPAQIEVILEQRQSQLKTVRPFIEQEPPPNYERGDPSLSETQVLVSGTQAQVDRVDHLMAIVDLEQQRDSFEDEVELVAVDANGNFIPDSEIEFAQSVVRVTIDITQIPDARRVSVFPDIDFDSVQSGYVARLESFSPEAVSLTGTQNQLNRLPQILETEVIDLADQTESFTTTALLEIPVQGIELIEGSGNVEVTITIEAVPGSRVFEEITVTVNGENPAQPVTVEQQQVTVLIDGPQPLLDSLTPDNIQVLIDVQDLVPGTYSLEPVVNMVGTDVEAEQLNVRAIPTIVNVTVGSGVTPTEEAQS